MFHLVHLSERRNQEPVNKRAEFNENRTVFQPNTRETVKFSPKQ